MIAAARIQRMTRLFDAHIIAGEEHLPRGAGPSCSIASWERPGSRASRSAQTLYEILGPGPAVPVETPA